MGGGRIGIRRVGGSKTVKLQIGAITEFMYKTYSFFVAVYISKEKDH